nr:hypothetical protein HAGR004_18430 [Bdellovibrio sp. HAGR004]
MKTWIAFVLLLLGISAEAKTLLVSDIDDTIKLAHVKDLSEAARFAFDSQSRFLGMSELYQLIDQDQPDLDIVYLSRAPNWLMGRTHRKFLVNGGFPEGQYINRTNYDSDVHKLYSLRDIMNRVRPDTVIFLGDNGEQDAEVYQQISQEYANKGIRFHQFIRVVYSNTSFMILNTRLQSGQVGFVTPIEVAVELEKAGILKTSSVDLLMDALMPEIMIQKNYTAEGVVAFPYFVNCRDFVWRWDADVVRFAPLKDLKKRVVERCKIRP